MNEVLALVRSESYDKRIEKKVNLLLENKIEPNSYNLGLLDELWDEEERFHEERVKEVINKIRNRSEQIKFLKKKVASEVTSDVRNMGLTDDQFEINEAETIYKRKCAYK